MVRFDGFRRLWIGQIFSQLADKFYIVLMVYLIAQYWVTNTPQDNGALAEIASAIRMDFETRAQRITLLATGFMSPTQSQQWCWVQWREFGQTAGPNGA